MLPAPKSKITGNRAKVWLATESSWSPLGLLCWDIFLSPMPCLSRVNLFCVRIRVLVGQTLSLCSPCWLTVSYDILHNLFLTRRLSSFSPVTVLNSGNSNYGPGNADSVKFLPYCPALWSHTGKQQEAQALAWEACSHAPSCQLCMLKNRV